MPWTDNATKSVLCHLFCLHCIAVLDRFLLETVTMEWSVTSHYHGSKFLDHINWELRRRHRRRQRELEKSNRFISEKQQLGTCIRLFCTFLSRRCTTWNFQISRTCFTEYASTTQKFPFSCSKLHTVLSDLTAEIFAVIWQIIWNWIRSSKFETVRIRFLLISSDVFGLLSSKNFATMATWRNDFSSLLPT